MTPEGEGRDGEAELYAQRALEPDSELVAELYDCVHRGNPGDGDFYERMCGGATRVLELGSGSGRILERLLASGERRCVGLDTSHGLLALARQRLSHSLRTRELVLAEGDMASFELSDLVDATLVADAEGRFDRILIPYNGLYCLLDESRLESCLECVARCLAPNGRLILDIWPADGFHAGGDASLEAPDDQDDSDDEGELVVQLEHRGELLGVFERTRWHREPQRLDVVYDYRLGDGTLRARIEVPQRYLLAEQIERLFGSSGLVLREIYCDPAGPPYGSGRVDLSAASARAETTTDWLGLVAERSP